MFKNSAGLILAGGFSKRLFPYEKPKPLLIAGERSLLEDSLSRLSEMERTFVITNQSTSQSFHAFFENLNTKQPSYLLEPEARGTAAAIGFALRELQPKPEWIAILSADQYLKDSNGFQSFLKRVEQEIKKYPDSLFVSGSPSESKESDTHSSFGWILPEQSSSKSSASLRVEEFVEKPEGKRLSTLRDRGALINAGMFFGRYATFLKAYEDLYAEVLKPCCDYAQLENTPIDRAIFEKFKNVRVFPFDLEWEDLGTWESVCNHIGSHAFENSESQSVFVWNEDEEKEIHVCGMKDVAVINSGNKLLVMPLSQTSQMKKFLKTD